jgi:hypothetical protein
MPSPYGWPPAIARFALATLAAVAIATPASAQIGRLKKKVQVTATQETAAPVEQPGMIVLTDDVVSQLLTGLKAGQADRAAAAKEDTPFGRYKKAEAAYAEARPKCEAAQQTFPQRAAGNQKMLDKYSALTEKLVAAQDKGDMKLLAIYQDSAMAMQDPSCTVKEPERPKDYYQAQRDMDVRAEKQEAKASGFSPGELAMVKERAIAILQGSTPPGDASPREKAAVSAKAAELRPLLGLVEQPTARAAKPAPEPAPTPAAAPAPAPDPQTSAAASKMGDCMAKNMQSHQVEIEALSKRAQAAQKGQDTQKLMAIADTLQQLQMAGCMGR